MTICVTTPKSTQQGLEFSFGARIRGLIGSMAGPVR